MQDIFTLTNKCLLVPTQLLSQSPAQEMLLLSASRRQSKWEGFSPAVWKMLIADPHIEPCY